MSRIDRYNLLRPRGKRSPLRSILFALLVTCVYVVEMAFEFSSEGVPEVPTLAQRPVYNASYSACDAFRWPSTKVAPYMASMAKSCVDLSDNEYTLYRPVWIKTESQVIGQTVHCAKVPKNVLRKGERIYKDRRFTEGTPSWDAAVDMVAALKANSSRLNDDGDSSLVIMSISTNNVLFSGPTAGAIFQEDPSTTSNSADRPALVLVRVRSRTSNLFCGGLIHGGVGDKVFKIRMYGCFQESTSGLHYLQVQGTAPVFVDPDRMESEYWTVNVAVYLGIAIRDFARGVINPSGNISLLNLVTYTRVISATGGKDSDSLNRYAAIYKHCDLLKVAVPKDNIQLQDVEYVLEKQRITVSLAEWGLTLMICWSFTLWIVARILLTIATRKGMPKAVGGEIGISRRWATQEDMKQNISSPKQSQGSPYKRWFHCNIFSQSKQTFLNVELGTKYDDIVASRTPTPTIRDMSKPFSESKRRNMLKDAE